MEVAKLNYAHPKLVEVSQIDKINNNIYVERINRMFLLNEEIYQKRLKFKSQ